MDDMLIGVGVKANFGSVKTESKAAAEALRTAEQNMKEALEQFGQAAEQGSAQAIAALKSYEAELAEAQARSAVAAQSLGAAGNAAAHSVPQYAAASGALRTLEGNFSHNIRAAERFLTTSLGLGPALQMAFPLVGAIAFAGVLYEMGKGLVKFGTDAAELSRELGVGWLDAAIAEMDGFADEVKLADKEMDSLARNMDHLKEKGRELDIEHIRATQGPRAAYEAQIEDQHQKIKALTASLALNRQQQEEEAKDALPRVSYDPKSGVRSEEMTEDSIRAQVHLKQLGEDAKETGLRITDAQKEIQRYNDEIANIKPPKEPKDHSARDAAKEHGAEVMAMVKENADAQREGQRVTDEVQAAGIRLLKQEEEEQHKASEAEKGRMEDSKRTFEEHIHAEEKDAESAAENAIAQIDAAAKVAEARIAYMLATGAISQQEAAHARAAIEAHKYTDQIKALEDELLALKAIQNEGGNTGDKQGQIGTKITALSGDRDAALIQGAAKQAGEYTRLWQHALAAVGRQFQNVEDQMLRGQISFSTGMKRMTSEVALDAIHWTERWLQQHFMANAMKLASSVTTNAGTVASDASAAAASTAITRSTALHQAFIHAKLAAVKAFDWGTGWGGPLVGAIMAAGAFTGAMAWAMFEQGGVAQATGPAYLHAGERVLTARQTATFDRVMSGGSSTTTRSSSVSNHFGGNTFNGVADQKTFANMLRKNNREVAKATQRALRNGHFSTSH